MYIYHWFRQIREINLIYFSVTKGDLGLLRKKPNVCMERGNSFTMIQTPAFGP